MDKKASTSQELQLTIHSLRRKLADLRHHGGNRSEIRQVEGEIKRLKKKIGKLQGG